MNNKLTSELTDMCCLM